MHIAIAGNIGSGKTTLTKMLAAHYGWTPKFESVDFNPYLSDFYADMERWSFNLQVYFLNKRFKDVVDISRCEDVIIQDRTIYEDARIFAPNLHDMGLMSTRDFENYSDLFDLMMSLVSKPDLLIYLKSTIPNLVAQIQKEVGNMRAASASTISRASTSAMTSGSPNTTGIFWSSMWTTSNSRTVRRISRQSPTRSTRNFSDCSRRSDRSTNNKSK